MVKSRDLWKVMFVLPVVLFRKCNLLLPVTGETLPMAEVFLKNIFMENALRIETNITVLMSGMLEIVIFSLLFGAHLYHDLYENSVYIFIRQKSRSRWYAKRAAELFLFSVVYSLLFVGGTFLLCRFYTGQRVDTETAEIFAVTYILIALFSFWITLMINITAVFTGSVTAFLIHYIIFMIFTALAIDFEGIPVINQFRILLKLNPAANLMVFWNDGIGRGLMPAAYFLVLCAGTYAAGTVLITRMDISIENTE